MTFDEAREYDERCGYSQGLVIALDMKRRAIDAFNYADAEYARAYKEALAIYKEKDSAFLRSCGVGPI